MDSPFQSLRRTEAETRAALLEVTAYEVRLDLRGDGDTFGSHTRITFHSNGGPTFVDIKPLELRSVRLNGDRIDPATLDRGRLPLTTVPGENQLVVEAVMGYRRDGEGLHMHTDPADGRRYIYQMSFMDAAPHVFACFDQPDLKAPYSLTVQAPTDWVVVGNGPGTQVAPGEWAFQQTPPLSTYFVTLVAGPYHLITDEHDGIPLGLSARRSIAGALERDAEELLTITRACFDEFHRLFGIRYPFGNYHQAFVPEFNAGAMENPGCVTFRDPMIFTSRVTRGERVQRATTVAHEMAHQWFGNLTTPRWWDDLWLNESFAEYMGNRVTADVTEFTDAWTHHAYARRQWGLTTDQSPSTHPVAGNGATDAASALQDFDGISYVKGSSILKQLNATLGDEVFFRGVVDHFTTHRFGNATMQDLLGAWERSGAGDLSGFAEQWLTTAGPDVLHLDRGLGTVHRTSPADHPADRTHTFGVSEYDGNRWSDRQITVGAAPAAAGTSAPVVLLDPYEDTWAVAVLDPDSASRLPDVLPRTEDERLRAGAWNTVRSTYHRADLDPEVVIRLVERVMVEEPLDDALHHTMPWVIDRVVPLCPETADAGNRVHEAMAIRLGSAPPGSSLQLAAAQAYVRSTSDPAPLQEWLADRTPEGLVLDQDLRWAVLVQLATLAAVDQQQLDDELDRDPGAKASVQHARATASRPDPAAKSWAWDRFTGAAEASNYELEAAGLGLWRPGQQGLTEPFVNEYLHLLPELHTVHAGWVLGSAVRAFFPSTHLSADLVHQADSLAAQDGLDATVRRGLVDSTDALRRRILVRQRWGDPGD